MINEIQTKKTIQYDNWEMLSVNTIYIKSRRSKNYLPSTNTIIFFLNQNMQYFEVSVGSLTGEFFLHFSLLFSYYSKSKSVQKLICLPVMTVICLEIKKNSLKTMRTQRFFILKIFKHVSFVLFLLQFLIEFLIFLCCSHSYKLA